MKRRSKQLVVFSTVAVANLISFQNCGQNIGFSQTSSSTAADSVQSAPVTHTEQIAVSASKTNPPLDLFFVVDNSASMAAHQIDLGKNFAQIFTSNSSNLANFDATIYIYSTASTINSKIVGSIPTRSPASLTSLPAITDISALAALPGAIFGLSNSATGTYGQSGYTAQFLPAALPGTDSTGAITPSLTIAHIGSQSQSDYAAKVAALTQSFQQRLADLSPNNYIGSTQQSLASQSTDISSGLCTMARVLRHAKDQSLVKDGDAAAFILVSDDNDRLNDRNTYGNTCAETFADQASVINGACGHDQVDFSYNTSSALTYKSDSKFTYESKPGTKIPFTYLNGKEDCAIKYDSSATYAYTFIYTQLQTAVTYQKCAQIADGTCISPSAATVTVKGNYVGSGSSCSLNDMSTVAGVTLAAPSTSYSCVSANLAGQTGHGSDSASNGSTCSASVISALTADMTKSNVECAIVAGSLSYGTSTKTVAGLPAGSCASYCSSNSTAYPGCQLVSTTPEKSSSSLNFASDGVTCNSTCPDTGLCESGKTVAASLSDNYGTGAVCSTASATLSTLYVYGVASANGAALTCSSPLAGLTAKNSSGQVVCSNASTISDCVQSLQDNPSGASTCVASGTDTAAIATSPNISCSTECSASNGLCNASQYGTVAQYIAGEKKGYCSSAANGAAKTLSLALQANMAPSATCATKCSATLSGSCDGKGWGASDSSTVADYILSLSAGSSCAVSKAAYIVTDATTKATQVPVASSANSCAGNAANPLFVASGSSYLTTGSTLVTGASPGGTETAADLRAYIYQQAKTVFSANNLPTVAVIGHLAEDNLPGTDVSADYTALTGADYFNSNQVTDVGGNYAASLSSISTFIEETAQSSFVITLPTGSTMSTVSIRHPGDMTWTPVSSAQWNYSGSTLSVNAQVGLKVGDLIQYQYLASQ